MRGWRFCLSSPEHAGPQTSNTIASMFTEGPCYYVYYWGLVDLDTSVWDLGQITLPNPTSNSERGEGFVAVEVQQCHARGVGL